MLGNRHVISNLVWQQRQLLISNQKLTCSSGKHFRVFVDKSGTTLVDYHREIVRLAFARRLLHRKSSFSGDFCVYQSLQGPIVLAFFRFRGWLNPPLV
jgi:hypothetical protein